MECFDSSHHIARPASSHTPAEVILAEDNNCYYTMVEAILGYNNHCYTQEDADNNCYYTLEYFEREDEVIVVSVVGSNRY